MIRLTRAQVREIDRRAIEQYHIPGIVLMENAARAASNAAMGMFRGRRATQKSAAIVCGGGNNGGDGLAIARHLHNLGVLVTIVQAWEKEPSGDAAINWRVIQAMEFSPLPMKIAKAVLNPISNDLVIDALFGTGLSSAPRGEFATLIGSINNSRLPVLAVDLPSGLDCDSGEPLGPCVRATRTITFVAQKAGFANPASRAYTGDIIVGDIGCPRELIEQVRRDVRG